MNLRLTFILLLFSFQNLVAQIQEMQGDDLLLKSIYFGGGSYYVTPGQADEMEDFILEVEDLEHYQVIIFSHTDNIGGKEYNEWLSKMRSGAVREVLLKIPVSENQIEIRNFGQENPLYSNRENLGRRANRRVDVILVPIMF